MKLLCSIKETARQSGLGEHRIRHLAKTDPRFPAVRIGNVIKINYEQFSLYIKKAAEEGRPL